MLRGKREMRTWQNQQEEEIKLIKYTSDNIIKKLSEYNPLAFPTTGMRIQNVDVS